MDGFSLIEVVVYASLLSILLVSFIGYIGAINDKNFYLLNEIQDKLYE
jgi:Tfp pilus assembly protein PilV